MSLQVTGQQVNDIDKTIVETITVNQDSAFTLAQLESQMANLDLQISNLQQQRAAIVTKHNDAITQLGLNVPIVS